ncbi:hypothetical protein BC834DRAFT_969673 [Gloeopeniophorella convolvens]|nr:hypothetical protein BC834DRAFT_969673 [Gloeopeniophorella convolvens]
MPFDEDVRQAQAAGDRHSDEPVLGIRFSPVELEDLGNQTSQADMQHATRRLTLSIPPAGNETHGRGAKADAGENYDDSSGEMWNLYLKESGTRDERVSKSWGDNTGGILVFTGLFSATVAGFIIESYKLLSVDSGDQTVALLNQVSRQLFAISNGERLTSPPSPNAVHFKPSASAIRVNIMWFLSLALSLTCALSATLMQEWSRQYMELASHRGAPHKRARVRAYLFNGIERFQMARAVETIPLLLHISVFLFFIGLVDFLLPINKTVAWIFVGYVALFTAVYAVMTLLPNFFLNCPYRTPLSAYLWKLSQVTVLTVLVPLNILEKTFHIPLYHLWQRTHIHLHQHMAGPTSWRKRIKSQISTHRKWYRAGLRQSVVLTALDAPSSVDKEALNWTLAEFDEDHEVEDYIARIPGFFDSRVPNAPHTMLDLMAPSPRGDDAVLAVRLHSLLRTCLPGGAVLEPQARRKRMRACLTTLWYYARAYCTPETKEQPMPESFRVLFAQPNDMNDLRADTDLHSRLSAQCIYALVASRLATDVSARTGNFTATEGEVQFMKNLLGTLWQPTLFSPFGVRNCGATQLANLVTLLRAISDAAGVPMSPTDIPRGEVGETLKILVQSVLSYLPETLPDNPSHLDPIYGYYPGIEHFQSLYGRLDQVGHLKGILRHPGIAELSGKLRTLAGRLPPPIDEDQSAAPESEQHQPDDHFSMPAVFHDPYNGALSGQHLPATATPPSTMPEPTHYTEPRRLSITTPMPDVWNPADARATRSLPALRWSLRRGHGVAVDEDLSVVTGSSDRHLVEET